MAKLDVYEERPRWICSDCTSTVGHLLHTYPNNLRDRLETLRFGFKTRYSDTITVITPEAR